mgnify:CR=1 FL=1
MKFFEFNIATNKLTLLESELMTIDCFKKLIYLYNSPQRITLEQTLSFIWYVTDITSPGVLKGLTEKDLEIEAKNLFNIPANWTIHPIIGDCILYLLSNDDADKVTLKELSISMNNIANLVKVINAEISDKIEKGNLTKDEIKDSLGYINQINDILGNLPSNVERIAVLRRTILDKEKNVVKQARGGDNISASMNSEVEENI